MKDSNKIYKNKMSMFDLLKGIAIFIVVFWHTYDYWNGNPALIGIQIPLNLIWLGLCRLFSWRAGYWYKPKPVAGYIEKSDKCLMKPYAFVGLWQRDAVPSLLYQISFPEIRIWWSKGHCTWIYHWQLQRVYN